MPIYALDGEAPEIPTDGSVYIAPTAVIIGRVRLLPNASVWWGAVLRGDNEWIEVGEGANIQDNAVCHTDIGAPLTVGAGATIGHSVILHGCTIGKNALIGMGSSILNHAVVGEGALVGANALVAEGKTVEAGMLAVGAPAKVRRPLTEAETARILKGSADYVAKGVRYGRACHEV
ncbi:MAG: gamma carbonic anhydrase family protein [Devosia sp.]